MRKKSDKNQVSPVFIPDTPRNRRMMSAVCDAVTESLKVSLTFSRPIKQANGKKLYLVEPNPKISAHLHWGCTYFWRCGAFEKMPPFDFPALLWAGYADDIECNGYAMMHPDGRVTFQYATNDGLCETTLLDKRPVAVYQGPLRVLICTDYCPITPDDNRGCYKDFILQLLHRA